MKKLLFIAIFGSFLLPGMVHAAAAESKDITPYLDRDAGGPDAFGYTWADSNEPGGPVFSWVDITGVGTQVTGLADDNSVAMMPMGMDFFYYWITFSDIKIGSNGWLSFDNVSNVAHCFPALPTPGGAADNLVAPFMSDLNFTGAGNIGEVYYYHDAVNEEFIVSFINVPWWVNANPAYIGSNTFQVILSAVDNSITYQYLDMDPASFNDTAGCPQDLTIGFENTTGNVGISISAETVPADNYAIKITYPTVPLLNIVDLAPIWNQNDENKGVFAVEGEDLSLVTRVQNTGNTDAVNDIDVAMQVLDASNMPVYSDADTLMGLVAQDSADVMFSTPLNVAAGTHRLQATTTSGEDINPGNNINESELVVVDTSVSPVSLGFSDTSIPDGIVSWTGGNGGAGVFVQPPVAGWHIASIEMFVQAGGGIGADYTVGIYANDNGDGLPGTLLDSVVVPEGSYSFDTWVETTLPTSFAAPSNGFFVSWEQINAEGVVLGTETNAPISRQSYELLGGQWAAYRNNQTTELMIRVNMIDLIFADGFN